MGRTGQWRWAVPRAVLLAAVLSGLFGMHVLTAEDAAAGHGMLPVMTAAQHDGHDPAMVSASPAMQDPGDAVLRGGEEVTAAGSGSDGGHGAMTGCVLFLVIGGAAVLLMLLRRRGLFGAAGLGGIGGAAVMTDPRRRGPPSGWPRLSLCVIRV